MYDGMMHGAWMWVGAVLSMLFAVVLLVLLVLATVWLYRRVRDEGEDRGRAQRDDPLEIARRRYARGEIGEEEYRRMMEELS